MAHSIDLSAAKLREDLGTTEVQCDKHGTYISSGQRILICRPPKEIWSKCPGCEADAKKAEHEAAAVARASAERARIEEVLKDTALPSRFIGKTLATYIAETDGQRKAHAICNAYAQNFDRGLDKGASLIFSGLPGTGKSHLAGGIIQAILPRHVGIYVTMLDLIRMLRDTWRRDSDISETDVLARLSSVPLLVIDEVGVQYGTDAERTLFFDVMDRRYRNLKPVILLTNLGMNEFKTTVGERVYDRLTEVARWVPFDWPSHRPAARRAASDAT